MRYYLGPYYSCTPRGAPGFEARTACGTVNCPAYGRPVSGIRYCSQCGHPVPLQDFPTEVETPDRWEVADAVRERLTCARANQPWDGRPRRWLANIPVPRCRNFWVERVGDVALTPDLLAAELVRFQQHFARAETRLREAYGAARVALEYGLVYCDD